jgi:hypothetical protein
MERFAISGNYCTIDFRFLLLIFLVQWQRSSSVEWHSALVTGFAFLCSALGSVLLSCFSQETALNYFIQYFSLIKYLENFAVLAAKITLPVNCLFILESEFL